MTVCCIPTLNLRVANHRADEFERLSACALHFRMRVPQDFDQFGYDGRQAGGELLRSAVGHRPQQLNGA